MTNKSDLMNRIATASQAKIYPAVHTRTETPLRKILLSSRIWNHVRREQEEEERQKQQEALSNDDWWMAATAVANSTTTSETLTSFAFNEPLSDSESNSLLEATNFFLTSQPLTTADWTWLEEEIEKGQNGAEFAEKLLSTSVNTSPASPTSNNNNNNNNTSTTTDLTLLSHDEPPPLLHSTSSTSSTSSNTTTTTTHTTTVTSSPINDFLNNNQEEEQEQEEGEDQTEEEDDEDFEAEEWLTIANNANIPPMNRKRQRDSSDDVQDFPSKKVLTNEAFDLITAAALLTSSVHPPSSCPPSPPPTSGPLLRV